MKKGGFSFVSLSFILSHANRTCTQHLCVTERINYIHTGLCGSLFRHRRVHFAVWRAVEMEKDFVKQRKWPLHKYVKGRKTQPPTALTAADNYTPDGPM